MKILFTGTSSFTGYHFANEFAKHENFEVHAIISNRLADYSGLKKKRLESLNPRVVIHEGVKFGDELYLELINNTNSPYDVLCTHGAYVENYNSEDFDVIKALEINTNNIGSVVRDFSKSGGRVFINTGSIFEPGEGTFGIDENAFNPYGLSKKHANDVFQYHCHVNKVRFGKFVIPNPFGLLEEPRFTNYLFTTWRRGDTPIVLTPKYIRDNIPVNLLAMSYVDFVKEILADKDACALKTYKFNPSGYIESQGEFSKRILNYLITISGRNYCLDFYDQVKFTQPMARYNNSSLFDKYNDWDEKKFWNDYIISYCNDSHD